MISAPASANAIAIACPMPLVPPVTNAVWPSSENSFMTFVILVGFLGVYRLSVRSCFLNLGEKRITSTRLDGINLHNVICDIAGDIAGALSE